MNRKEAEEIATGYTAQCESEMRHWGWIDGADQPCRDFLFFNTDYYDDLPPEEDGISCFGHIGYIKEGEPMAKYMNFVINAIERPSQAEREINTLKEANFAKWYFGGEQETADDQNDLGDIYSIGMGALRKKVANVPGSYYSGNVIQKDYVEAVKWYRKAAEQGFANAQVNLGFSYASGEGVKQDDVEAVKWYRKAAEQGHANAQYNLGVSYVSGEGVKQDEVEAVKWYRKAAEQGFANAQVNLGCKYDSGEGVTQDEVEAVKWYRKAAEQGHADAQCNLGVSYASGEGVKQDDVEAVKWYRKAAEQGHANAQYNLGCLLFDRGDLDGAEEILRKGLSAQERSLGPEHATTLAIIANLGIVLSKIANNKHDEAADLFLRAHTGFKNTLGLDAPQTLAAIRLLGSNKKRGDVEGAINCLKEYFDHSEATRDGLAFNLACYECLNGNFEEAKALITEHLERHPDAKEQALSDADLESIHDFIGNV